MKRVALCLFVLLCAAICAGDRRRSDDRHGRMASRHYDISDDRQNHHHNYHHNDNNRKHPQDDDDDDDNSQAQRDRNRNNDNNRLHHHHHNTDRDNDDDDNDDDDDGNRGVHHISDFNQFSRWQHTHDDDKPPRVRDHEQRDRDNLHRGNDGHTQRKGAERHPEDRQRNNKSQNRNHHQRSEDDVQHHRGDRYQKQERREDSTVDSVQERSDWRRHQDQERSYDHHHDHENRHGRDNHRHHQRQQERRESGQLDSRGGFPATVDGHGQEVSRDANEQPLTDRPQSQQMPSSTVNKLTDNITQNTLNDAEEETHQADILPPVAELPAGRPTAAAAEDWEGVGSGPPPRDDAAAMARYIVHVSDWAAMATISTRPPTVGMPFANVFSVADGTRYRSTGIPYMYLTGMEISVHDLRINNNASLTMSLAQSDYCAQNNYDPESPLCAHVILSGSVLQLDPTDPDLVFARDALFSRHPEMADWPASHNWFVAQLDIMNVIVLDYFGGAKTVTPAEYFAASPFTVDAGRETNRL